MKKSKIICSIALVVLMISANSLLNAQSEEQKERLKKERREFFTRELELTESESAAFWPVYDDFQSRKMRIMEEERNHMKYTRENEDNLSAEEAKQTLEKILALKKQMGKLDQEYYSTKFPAVLPPKKALRLYTLEWDFRRHLMREIRGHGQGGPGGKGQGRRNQYPAPGI